MTNNQLILFTIAIVLVHIGAFLLLSLVVGNRLSTQRNDEVSPRGIFHLVMAVLLFGSFAITFGVVTNEAVKERNRECRKEVTIAAQIRPAEQDSEITRTFLNDIC